MLDLAPTPVTDTDRAEAAVLDTAACRLEAMAEGAVALAAALRRMAAIVRTRGAGAARPEREAVTNTAMNYIVLHAAVTAAFQAVQRLVCVPPTND